MRPKARREGGWTVCLIPDDPTQETVRFRLHRRFLSVLLGVGAGLLGWSVFVTTHYVWLQRSYQRLVRMEDEYEQMKQDFMKVRQYSYRLQSDLEKMEQQVRRLQIIAGVTAGGNIPQIAGVGGESAPAPEAVGRVHLLEQQWWLAQSQQKAEVLQDQLDQLYEYSSRSRWPCRRPLRFYRSAAMSSAALGRASIPSRGLPTFIRAWTSLLLTGRRSSPRPPARSSSPDPRGPTVS